MRDCCHYTSLYIKFGLGVVLLFGCVSQDFDEALKKSKENSTAGVKTESVGGLGESTSVGICPDGTRFNPFPRVCVTRGGFALGPFPLELQELCRQKSPDDASTCVQKQDWPFELLMSLSTSYKLGCPPGTSPGDDGVCVGPDNVFGPFTLQQIMACRAAVPASQQKQCDDIVWPPDFLKFASGPSAVKKSPEGTRANDDKTMKDEFKAGSSPAVSPDDSSPVTPEDLNVSASGTTAQPSPQRHSTIQSPEVAKGGAELSRSEAQSERGEKEENKAKPDQEKQKSESKVEAVALEEEVPAAPTFCVYSWDERPGTADLTTLNRKLISLRQSQNYAVDRTEEWSLLGSRDFQSLDMCGRARFLKGCFQKVIYDNHSPAAQTFRTWALGRVRPLEAHMAFVMNQTRLGLWHDECWKGQCKGIGISRVTAARTVRGKRYSNEDVLWRGITHNIVTNLRFGLRQIVVKVALGPSDLYQLAYSFNGVPGRQEQFAQQVDKFYRQLISCQLD